MAHSITPVPAKTINATPGSTITFKITVNGVVEPGPEPAASGVITVQYAGHDATTPLEVEFAAGPVGPPTASVDLGGATNLTAVAGTPIHLGVDRYEIPITLTVV